MERYAINIGDLTKEPILGMIFADVLKSKKIVTAEKNLDGAAVIIDCGRERAKSIVETIRLKREKHYLRCYVSSTGKSWKRI